MLKSSSLCSSLNQVAEKLTASVGENVCYDLSLISDSGQIIASFGCDVDFKITESLEQVSAILSSISNEYRALERLEGYEYKSIISVTDSRISLFSILIKTSETCNISVVISAHRDEGTNVHESLGILRTLNERIHVDLVPSLRPVLAASVSD
jgi:hypothetical protein